MFVALLSSDHQGFSRYKSLLLLLLLLLLLSLSLSLSLLLSSSLSLLLLSVVQLPDDKCKRFWNYEPDYDYVCRASEL